MYELGKHGHGYAVNADIPFVWMQTIHELMRKDMDKEMLQSMASSGN